MKTEGLPTDGTSILARGWILHDADHGIFHACEPFVLWIRCRPDGEWVRTFDGLTVRCSLDERLILDAWHPAPWSGCLWVARLFVPSDDAPLSGWDE